MKLHQIPILLIGLTLAGYWFRVLRMAQKAKRRSGRAANLIPRETTGRWNRILWAPVIVVWICHPLYSALLDTTPVALVRPLATVPPGLKWTLAAVVMVCMGLTVICWRKMGKSWRMGIDTTERTTLIFTGPYAWVRHPIYALSLVMMIATMMALPSPLMWAAGATHIVLLVWEARREEHYLAGLHGEVYRQYCSCVGRFVPRLDRRSHRPQAGGQS